MRRLGLFRKTRELDDKIDTFLLNIIQGGLLFARALDVYLKSGITPDFIQLKEDVSALETENDSLRRVVENDLYAHMILPDMRSDILKLLEGCDRIINKYESDLILLSIEKTHVPAQLHAPLKQMIAVDLDCAGALVGGARAFFKGEDVNEYIKNVYDLEHVVDEQAIALKQLVFDDARLELARQLQLKMFIYGIEKVSDMAEDVADALTVIAVKHAL